MVARNGAGLLKLPQRDALVVSADNSFILVAQHDTQNSMRAQSLRWVCATPLTLLHDLLGEGEIECQGYMVYGIKRYYLYKAMLFARFVHGAPSAWRLAKNLLLGILSLLFCPQPIDVTLSTQPIL